MAEDDKIIFYYAPHSRATTVHWMLEEVGAPYELRCLNLKNNDQKQPDYLVVNPMGKVPAIVHRGVVVTEVAAICAYLADVFPEAKLAPAIGDPRRGAYLRWLFFSPSCLEPAVTDHALKREPGNPSMLAYGDYDTTIRVVAGALRPGPYLLGETFSAADVVLGSGLRWMMMFKIVPELPEFVAYVERLNLRPASQRSRARDAEFAAAQAV